MFCQKKKNNVTSKIEKEALFSIVAVNKEKQMYSTYKHTEHYRFTMSIFHTRHTISCSIRLMLNSFAIKTSIRHEHALS